ncbi:MAG: hypothetical protein IBX48_06965 [Thiomicrospira sp.]|uniref:hypothetical protein n=1 Tax=Thiomicrospira sp. TaxID=935 RepID=UPI0019EEBA76|nr:hypothetical protein [Thiomicrospira sp.]MBE0494068.1 hypothetical protein [Thiomicrospira sp.]
MDWQQQDEFLQRWPALHSLLAAYIAIDEDSQAAAIQAFKRENPNQIQATQQALIELLEINHQAWWLLAANLASQQPSDHQAWLQELITQLQQEAK